MIRTSVKGRAVEISVCSLKQYTGVRIAQRIKRKHRGENSIGSHFENDIRTIGETALARSSVKTAVSALDQGERVGAIRTLEKRHIGQRDAGTCLQSSQP